jgi:hypothetical protein
MLNLFLLAPFNPRKGPLIINSLFGFVTALLLFSVNIDDFYLKFLFSKRYNVGNHGDVFANWLGCVFLFIGITNL